MLIREVTPVSQLGLQSVSLRRVWTLSIARPLIWFSMLALLQVGAVDVETAATTTTTAESCSTSTLVFGALAQQVKTYHDPEVETLQLHDNDNDPKISIPIAPTIHIDLPVCIDDSSANDNPTTDPAPISTDHDPFALAPRQGLYGNHHNAPDPNHNPPPGPAHTGNSHPTSPDDNTNPENTGNNPDNTTDGAGGLPSDTSLPFPQNMYDSPAHAVAAGLLVGTVATIGVWMAGCLARMYGGWIGRGVRATGWGRGVLYW